MKNRLVIVVICMVANLLGWSQSLTQITGLVRDSLTREPVAYATVTLKGTTDGTVTNDKGGFAINSRARSSMLRVSALGYRTKEVPIKMGQGSIVLVDLVETSVTLDEVVVNRGKEKYTKKGNPAVEFVERLRNHRNDNDPLRLPYYSFRKYERMVYGLNDIDDEGRKNIMLKKFDFLAEYADTSEVTGKRVLPVSVKEKVSEEYYRRSPSSHKEYIIGESSDGLDEQFDQASIKRFMDDIFREIDIFKNDVTLLSNRFVSPLSSIGPNFYKYFLSDTIDVGGERCVELSFVPFTPETYGFLGRLYVPVADTTMFVKRVKMSVPHSINLNYVERVSIEQDYERAADGSRLKVCDNMEVEFRVVRGTPGLFARRLTYYRDHLLDRPKDISIFSHSPSQIVAADASKQTEQFWVANRPHRVSVDGNAMKRMLARLRQSKFYYWAEKTLVALVNGYVPTSKASRWDFGPLNTFISGNSLEGARFRLGGMTTVNLSRHWFFRGYLAYGTRDERLKYMGQLEYSFNEKQHLDMEFPIHSIRLKHQYEVDKLGQNYLYTNADNVFLALKRQKDNKLAYLRTTELEYKYESPSHFSVAFGFKHLVHESSRFMKFDYPDGSGRKSYTEAGFSVTLRYAPGETFYQTRSYRIPINMDAPIMTLTHTYMPRGFMGSLYELNKTELGLQKRFWFSAFGYADIIIKGGKIWSQVPYPDLLLPNANLSYTIQNESYSLMNAMEFANDQYLSWDLTYWGNGVIMNRLPLVKKLKLREVFAFRGLWGSLSDKNNPANSSDVFMFPTESGCVAMGSKPYMEVSVGLDNILTFLRLDYVWRLTYRDRSGIDRSGVRLQLHFTF